jgi:hypothetical protein
MLRVVQAIGGDGTDWMVTVVPRHESGVLDAAALDDLEARLQDWYERGFEGEFGTQGFHSLRRLTIEDAIGDNSLRDSPLSEDSLRAGRMWSVNLGSADQVEAVLGLERVLDHWKRAAQPDAMVDIDGSPGTILCVEHELADERLWEITVVPDFGDDRLGQEFLNDFDVRLQTRFDEPEVGGGVKGSTRDGNAAWSLDLGQSDALPVLISLEMLSYRWMNDAWVAQGTPLGSSDKPRATIGIRGKEPQR